VDGKPSLVVGQKGEEGPASRDSSSAPWAEIIAVGKGGGSKKRAKTEVVEIVESYLVVATKRGRQKNRFT